MWNDDCTNQSLRFLSSQPGLGIRCCLLAGVCVTALLYSEVGKAWADPNQEPSTKNQEPQSKDQPSAKPSSENQSKPGQVKPDVKPGSKPDAAKKPAGKNVDVTPERELAALDFAGLHHPELVKLIAPLKTSNPKEYQHAIRELFRTSERLLLIKSKDPARHDLELEAWKVQSHIRLLTARLTMASDPALEADLRAALKRRAENQLKLLQNEQTTLQTRLDQVKQHIERAAKQSEDQFVQQEYDRLMKKTGRDKSSAAAKVKPGKTSTKPTTKQPEQPAKQPL